MVGLRHQKNMVAIIRIGQLEMEDKLYKFLKYYNSSPQFVKLVLGKLFGAIPLSIRYGQTYEKYAELLKKSQWWSKEEHEKYQLGKIKAIIKHAYHNVAYYRKIFDEIGLKPEDICSFSDFQGIPLLNRDDVINNKHELLASNYANSKLIYVTTGGTTGKPIGMYYRKGIERSRELAFMTCQWARVGYKIGDSLVTIRGNVIPNYLLSKGIFWEYEPIKKRLILSVYHMTDENMPLYIKQIRDFKPKFIHTYPSAVTMLAIFMKENAIDPFPSVKALLCSSEAFYPGQRELIENVFQCRIYSWYGHGEMTTLAGECEYSKEYHIFPEYGFTELVDNDGKVIAREEKIGEIIGTGFENWAMPFIRYRTGDFAEYSDRECECGRKYKLFKRVEGRWLQEMIVTQKGNLIPITALNMHSDVFDNVKQFQFYQDREGEVLFKIIPTSSFSERDIANIKRELTRKLAKDIKLEIQLVDEIARTQRGKYRFLIQKLPVEKMNWGNYITYNES